MLRPLCLLLALAAVTACTVETSTPAIEIEPGKVTIKADGEPRFCPPGQAKHGRC